MYDIEQTLCTMGKNESLGEIAYSIEKHVEDEVNNNYSNKAIGRAFCEYVQKGTSKTSVFWITKKPNNFSSYSEHKTTSECGGKPVYRDSPVGAVIIKYANGKYTYKVNKENVSIDILNRTTYNLQNNKKTNEIDVVDVEILIEGNRHRYYRLSDLIIEYNENQRELEEERRKLEEEKNEELKAQPRERIRKLEQQAADINERKKAAESFLRINAELRTQHLLDPSQEEAKRSNLFNGIPMVIEGGPGTGKTTTMIQRLIFLLSKEALCPSTNSSDNLVFESLHFDAPQLSLNKEQLNYLTEKTSERWLFFSPNKLLLNYLRKNMREEGLNANDSNTVVIGNYRRNKMLSYELFSPGDSSIFVESKNTKKLSGQLIKNVKKAVNGFEKYCIEMLMQSIQNRIDIDTRDYSWNSYAETIRRICRSTKVTNLSQLINLLNKLKNERDGFYKVQEELNDITNNTALNIKDAVMKNWEVVEEIKRLFGKWEKGNSATNEEKSDIISDVMDDNAKVIEETFDKLDFDAQLYNSIKELIKQLGIRVISPIEKMGKKYEELYSIISSFITDKKSILDIGKLAWFRRNFESMCFGVERVLFDKIPAMYKEYRKIGKAEQSGGYNNKLLSKVIADNKNKTLHIDEQDFLIGFINNMLYNTYSRFPSLFNNLDHVYSDMYKRSVRPVIGIDEATDYSLIDYYFMTSFKYYDFSSITLCGDILQGFNKDGIKNWKSLNYILPKIEVKSLNVSYRQFPTLLEVAKEMYKDDQGIYPTYESDKKKSDQEPKPLLFISHDDNRKAKWISDRIVEIYKHCNNELPSIAIFVGDKVNIDDFIDRINTVAPINGINIVDCSVTHEVSEDVVRVYRLSNVKGMEFEAVFFYDIDTAIKNRDKKLMRRYLYVGVSRAASHLAATMTSPEGNESIIKYFDIESDSWD